MRVKTGVTRKRNHKKVLKLAKGYWMSRGKQIKKAKEAVLHAGEYAYAGRKDKKGAFRRLWIIRLNAALKSHNIKYSQFMSQLKKSNIEVDRKILSYLALEKPEIFKMIINEVHKKT